MNIHDLFPWQYAQRDHLFQQFCSGRLAHAYLFHGPSGTGKTVFARALTGLLLCQQPSDGVMCGKCRSCQLLIAGSHPDVLYLKAEEGKQIVGVDHVRDSVDFISKTSSQGGLRIVIVPSADDLNINASNALLKTLEEPPQNTLICLITDHPALLLPTLRSRCQNVSFPVPDRKSALAWLSVHIDQGNAGVLLDLAGGAPLKALDYADPESLMLREKLLGLLAGLALGKYSVTSAMSDLDKVSLDALVELLMLTTKEVIVALSSGIREVEDTGFQDLLRVMPEGGSPALHVYYDSLLRIKRDLQRGLALNPKLAVFELLKEWQVALAGGTNKAAVSGAHSTNTLQVNF